MKLTKIDIVHNKPLQRQAKALYLQAFPKEERLPWWLLRLNARRRGIDITAYLDGEQFCGFTASVTVEGMHFLLFFAIKQSLRGKGYGSAILTQLRNEHQTVTLNIEPLIPTAPNLEERKNRFAFYRKNGFFDTGYHVWEVGGKFRVLSTNPSLDEKVYKRIFRKLSLGFWDVKIEKAGSE
ncbi:MAG: GNAT family N-acetyltransferase [Oscillospiraceae bacterium]|nr:GNAT family N-acetyltransferase [Oscillospiraceae bacterium]